MNYKWSHYGKELHTAVFVLQEFTSVGARHRLLISHFKGTFHRWLAQILKIHLDKSSKTLYGIQTNDSLKSYDPKWSKEKKTSNDTNSNTAATIQPKEILKELQTALTILDSWYFAKVSYFWGCFFTFSWAKLKMSGFYIKGWLYGALL